MAVEGGRVIGYLMAEIRKLWRGFSNNMEVHVHDLAVTGECRSRVIGSRLMKAIELHAKRLGIGYLTLDTDVSNPKALRFYKGTSSKNSTSRW